MSKALATAFLWRTWQIVPIISKIVNTINKIIKTIKIITKLEFEAWPWSELGQSCSKSVGPFFKKLKNYLIQIF